MKVILDRKRVGDPDDHSFIQGAWGRIHWHRVSRPDVRRGFAHQLTALGVTSAAGLCVKVTFD